MAGRTSDNVEELDVLTYDGLRITVGRTSEDELRNILAEGGRRAEIYRALDSFRGKYADLIRAKYPKLPRRVSGYANLDELLSKKSNYPRSEASTPAPAREADTEMTIRLVQMAAGCSLQRTSSAERI